MDEEIHYIGTIISWLQALGLPTPKFDDDSITQQSKSNRSLILSPVSDQFHEILFTESSKDDLIQSLKDGSILMQIAEKLWPEYLYSVIQGLSPTSLNTNGSPQTPSSSPHLTTSSPTLPSSVVYSYWKNRIGFLAYENVVRFLATAKLALEERAKRDRIRSTSNASDFVLFHPEDLLVDRNVNRVLVSLSTLALLFSDVPQPDTSLIAKEISTIGQESDKIPQLHSITHRTTLVQDLDYINPGSRSKLILHFFESEQNYVDILSFIDKRFMTPLSLRKDLIGGKDFYILFSNIRDLLAFHKSHLKHISDGITQLGAANSGDNLVNFGKIIATLVQGFELYKIYNANYMESLGTLLKYANRPHMREFLEARSEVACLMHLLWYPYQRTFYYSLTIFCLSHATPKDHGDFQPLLKASQNCMKLVRDVSDTRLRRRHMVLTNILKSKLKKFRTSASQSDLFADDGSFKVNNAGLLINDGFCHVGSEQKQQVYVMLMEKYLLICQYSLSSRETILKFSTSTRNEEDGMHHVLESVWTLVDYISTDHIRLEHVDSGKLGFRVIVTNSAPQNFQLKWSEFKVENLESQFEWLSAWQIIRRRIHHEFTDHVIPWNAIARYDRTPVENELQTLSSNMNDQLQNEVPDEKHLFWCLSMLAECASSNPPPVITAETKQRLKAKDKPQQSQVSLAIESLKKIPKVAKQSPDDDEEEPDSDEEFFRNGPSLAKVKAKKKSNSKARALLGFGIEAPVPLDVKRKVKSDVAIDDRAVVGSKPTLTDVSSTKRFSLFELLRKSSNLKSSEISVGNLLKSPGSDDHAVTSSTSRLPDYKKITTRALRDEHKSSLKSPISNESSDGVSMITTETQQTTQTSMEIIAHELRDIDPLSKRSSDQSEKAPRNCVKSPKSLKSRMFRDSASTKSANSLGRVANFKSKNDETHRQSLMSMLSNEVSVEAREVYGRKRGQTMMSVDSSATAETMAMAELIEAQDTQTLVLPIYLDHQNAYKKVKAREETTVNEVILQMLRKTGGDESKVLEYSLFESTFTAYKAGDKSYIRMARDMLIMDLYFWWKQTGQTHQRMLVFVHDYERVASLSNLTPINSDYQEQEAPIDAPPLPPPSSTRSKATAVMSKDSSTSTVDGDLTAFKASIQKIWNPQVPDMQFTNEDIRQLIENIYEMNVNADTFPLPADPTTFVQIKKRPSVSAWPKLPPPITKSSEPSNDMKKFKDQFDGERDLQNQSRKLDPKSSISSEVRKQPDTVRMSEGDLQQQQSNRSRKNSVKNTIFAELDFVLADLKFVDQIPAPHDPPPLPPSIGQRIDTTNIDLNYVTTSANKQKQSSRNLESTGQQSEQVKQQQHQVPQPIPIAK